MFKSIVTHIAIFALCFSQLFSSAALAQNLPITADGTTDTQVTKTASGIDQVNIAAPNSSGLSHNKFTDYNVNSSGQVINNFSGNVAAQVAGGSGVSAVTQTQIGGLVNVNENLTNSGSARIILNEVTSTHNTQLNGYAEIAGSRAELIIANPNGITCSGCGFINTSKFSLIAGRSEFDGNGDLNFDLKEQVDFSVPLISISGLGLDAENVSSADIIASSIKLLATIYGAENTDVKLIAGDGKYNYATKELAQNSPNINTEFFAIDASNLGVVQAGRIFITATRDGVGVNLGGDLLATKQLDIDSKGNIFYNNIIGGDKVNITSAKNINSINSNSAIAAPNLNLAANGNIENSGQLTAHNLIISKAAQLNNFGAIEALNLELKNIANLNNRALIYGEESLKISGANLSNFANSVIYSPQNYQIILTGLLANAGLILSDLNLQINADNLSNFSEISANNLELTIANLAENSGDIIADLNLNLSVFEFSNSGNLQSNNSAIALTNLTNSGIIFSGANQQIAINESLINSGEISANGTLAILGTSEINNLGLIISNGDLALGAYFVINYEDSVISSLSSNTNLISNSAINLGKISAANQLLISGETFANFSDLFANDVNLAVSNLENSGAISADNNLEISASAVENDGNILSENILTIDGSSLVNYGLIASLNSDINLSLSADLENSGILTASANLTLLANDIVNLNEISAANRLNIANQNLENSGIIFADNASFETADIINSGDILTNQNLNISAHNVANNSNSSIASLEGNLTLELSENITNSGIISAAINQNLSANNLNNMGDIFSGSDLEIKELLSLDNSGNIIAANQVIAARDVINSGIIHAENNLEISGDNLANYNEISAINNIVINVANEVENSAKIIAENELQIDANSVDNSSDALILANNDLTINAVNLSNQNTKPNDDSVKFGLISIYGNVNLQVDNFNNSSGIVMARATNLSSLNQLSVNLNNNSGSFVSTALIELDLGDTDYIITGEVTAANIDITANNITNLGNVNATDFIKLTADGTITNGVSLGDNSNIALNAGTYVELSSAGIITNYATISAETDLTITSNAQINNYGDITGGDGTTTINAQNVTSGVINNYGAGRITSNNDLALNANNITNLGEVAAANDVIITTTNNLTNNNGALIFAGRDATFNIANNLINTWSDIYADRNLTFQKNSNPTNNKMNLLQNVSGNIETYEGDILIKATTLENNRANDPVTGLISANEDCTLSAGVINCRAKPLGSETTADNHNLYNWTYVSRVSGQHMITNRYKITNHGIESQLPSVMGKISSGRNLEINIAADFTNRISEIYSVGNMSINSENFENEALTYGQTVYFKHWKDYVGGDRLYICGAGWCGKNYDYVFSDFKTFSSFIKSGGSLAITENGSSNSSLINGSNVSQYAGVSGNSRTSTSTIFNNIDSYILAETGKIDIDLSRISAAISSFGSAQGVSDTEISTSQTATLNGSNVSSSSSDVFYSGNFKIDFSPDPNRPLIESRSQFTDVSKYFGSSYYFDQLGLDGESFLQQINLMSNEGVAGKVSHDLSLEKQACAQNPQGCNAIYGESSQIIMLGDSYVETKLIRDTLSKLRSDAMYLSDSEANSNEEIKNLLDNSVSELGRLGFNAADVALNGLTVAQANLLEKDIITFEAVSFNGVQVLAPKLYLSQASRSKLYGNDLNSGVVDTTTSSLATDATIFSKGDLTINSPNTDLFNSGSIKSQGNINLTLNSLTNKTNNLSTAKIEAGLNYNNISSLSNKNLTITTTNDLKNLGATLRANNQINLTSTNGNIINSSLVATNDATLLASDENSYISNGLSNKATTGNISSTLLSTSRIVAGEININAANNFKNKAAELSATKNTLDDASSTSGDIVITAGDDVEIGTLQLRNRTETHWGNSKDGGTIIRDNVTNLASEITGQGSVTLSSGANVNIVGSQVTANEDLAITAGDNINILNAVDSNYYSSDSHKKGSTRATNSININYAETAVNSELNADNINLEAGSNILIQSSNLNSENNQTLAAENITIKDDVLNSYNYSHTSREYRGMAKVGANITSTVIGVIDLTANFLINTANIAAKPTIAALNHVGISEKITDPINPDEWREQKNDWKDTSIYNIKEKTFETNTQTTISSSNLNIGNNLEINASEDVAIIASNIETGTADTTPDKSDNSVEGNLNITANNISILADMETASTSRELKQTRTMMFSNGVSGYAVGNVVNSNLTAKNNNFNIDAENNITTSYNESSFNSETNELNPNQNTAGLNYLTYLKENKDNVIYNPLSNINTAFDDNTRGLTDAGTAIVAVGAVVAVIATAGAAGAPIAGTAAATGASTAAVGTTTIGIAVGSSLASTAAVSGTNTSMNVDGNFLNQAGDIGKQTAKDTTSKESLENAAIAGATAAVTFGLTQGINELTNSANATTAANGANTANTNLTLGDRFVNGLQNSAIQTVSSSVAQSTVTGDSLEEALKNSAKNLAINAVGEIAANEIGSSYHSGDIGKAKQLTLHAALGCGMALAGNNNCAAGSASGVIGESVGELVYDNGNGLSRQNTILTSQLVGALASAAVAGPDDGASVFAGSQIARNAVENNLTMVITGTDPAQKRSSSKDLDSEFRSSVEDTFDEKVTDFEWTGGNTKEARTKAASDLNNFVSNYEFSEGEDFNLIMFSHGGNVGKEFTQIYVGSKKIDNMIFLGTPHRMDYQVDLNDLNFYANRISVSDVGDGVQVRGYIDGSVLKGAITLPHNIRMMQQGFINIRADQNLGLIDNHITLPSERIWNDKVKPVLINR
jgi:filamentous hemagglutinin